MYTYWEVTRLDFFPAYHSSIHRYLFLMQVDVLSPHLHRTTQLLLLLLLLSSQPEQSALRKSSHSVLSAHENICLFTSLHSLVTSSLIQVKNAQYARVSSSI